ncbi:MAG: TIGR04255 family protein [Opitutaceae bacterium]|nr:TIGR04255 family protein [Cytophagales bacterium]
MNLPKQVTPDSVKEAVVEIRYRCDIPFEILLGMYFTALDNSYTYVSRPIQIPSINGPEDINFHTVNKAFFYNDKINLQAQPGSLVFTCLEEYLGWEVYKQQISKVLEQLTNIEAEIIWSRVGVRFLNHYPNKDLKEIMNFEFTFGMPNIKSITSSIKSEFDYRDSKVLLNLKNKVSLQADLKDGEPEWIPTSVIDIDVITYIKESNDLSVLLQTIDFNHETEKELYFNMLTPDFLKSLNPKY